VIAEDEVGSIPTSAEQVLERCFEEPGQLLAQTNDCPTRQTAILIAASLDSTRALSVLVESEPRLQPYILTRFRAPRTALHFARKRYGRTRSHQPFYWSPRASLIPARRKRPMVRPGKAIDAN
jgi:hypothetical protein